MPFCCVSRRDHGEQRHVVAHRAGRARACSARLLPALRHERRAPVARREVRIGRRIPGVGVDAVEDAVEVGRAVGEQPLQAHAERLALDLARVGRADGGDRVGVVERRLEEGQLAVVLDAVDRERLRAARRAARPRTASNMPWKARLWMVITRRGPRAPPTAQIRGREAGLPVVRVHHLRLPPSGESGLASAAATCESRPKRRRVVLEVDAVSVPGTARRGRS